MPWSSNGTFLSSVTLAAEGEEDTVLPAIYKPWRAERPLWDFPDGLYRREVAAFELARRLGWVLIPDTVRRDDGPLGTGSLQRFVNADFAQHYFTLLEVEAFHPALRRMAAFDVVANNADRKGGHCLVDGGGQIWGIDHGLCFHETPKLRTVIWDFAGEALAGSELEALGRFVEEGPGDDLAGLLSPGEVDAMMARAARLRRRGCLPEPRSDHPYPWPLV